MENGPKESIEELDAQVLSEEEQREYDEAEARKFEYDGKMLRARDIYRDMANGAEDPVDFEELPQSFQEMLALVELPQDSRIEGRNTSRIKDTPYVQATPAGLIYKGTTYPFVPDICEEINDTAIVSILEDAADMAGIDRRLESENASWQSDFKPRLKKEMVAVERKERSRKREAVKQEYAELYNGITQSSICSRDILELNPNLSDKDLESAVETIFATQRSISADDRLADNAILDNAEREAKLDHLTKSEAIAQREERLRKLGLKHSQLLSKLAELTGEDFDATTVKPLTAEKYKIELPALRKKVVSLELQRTYAITAEQVQKIIDTNYEAKTEAEIEQLLIDEHKLSQEEIDEAKEGKQKIQDLKDKLIDKLILMETGKFKNTSSLDGRLGITRGSATKAVGDLSGAIIRQISEAFNAESCRFPKEAYARTFIRELEYFKRRKVKDLPGDPDIEEETLTLEGARARIDRLVENGKLDRESIEETITELEEALRKRFSETLPRYYDAMARMGSSNNLNRDDEVVYREKMDEIGSDDEVEAYVSDQVDQKLQAALETIAKRLGGDSAQIAYILPTGIAIKFGTESENSNPSNKSYKALAISPIAPIIMDILPEQYREIWKAYWNESLGNSRYKGIAQAVNARLDQIVKKKLEEDIEFANDEDKSVHELLKKYSITQSGRVVMQNGDFEDMPDGKFIDALYEVIPKYNRFIMSIQRGYLRYETNTDNSPEARERKQKEAVERRRELAKNFLLRGTLPKQLYIDDPEFGKTLMVGHYDDVLLNAGEQEANRELLLEIGATLFDKHQDKIVPIMRKIIGGKIMGQRDVMRLTNARVDSAQQRELITMRAMFVGGFIKISRGEELKDPQLAKFVSRVTDIEFPKREGVN